jgi:hypothetical protein
MLNIKKEKQNYLHIFIGYFLLTKFVNGPILNSIQLTSFNFRIPEYPHFISSEHKSSLLIKHFLWDSSNQLPE